MCEAIENYRLPFLGMIRDAGLLNSNQGSVAVAHNEIQADRTRK